MTSPIRKCLNLSFFSLWAYMFAPADVNTDEGLHARHTSSYSKVWRGLLVLLVSALIAPYAIFIGHAQETPQGEREVDGYLFELK